MWDDATKDSYTLDRGKASNGIGVKSVLFAPGVEKSSSSYLLNEQNQHANNMSHSNSITPSSSTSQLIKQTLSPLVHHRHNNQQTSNSVSDAKNAASPLKMKPNNVSPFIANYQLTSNNFIMTNSNGNSNNKNNFSCDNGSANLPIQKTPSTARSLSSHTNTNTLPSHVGRSNNQYQFESNYLLKNKPKNFTSPENTTFFNALSSISSSASASSNASVTIANQTSNTSIMAASASSSAAGHLQNSTMATNNIYGTLPKSINSLANANSSGAIYGNVSAVASEFEQLIARNASGANAIGGNNTNAAAAAAIVTNNYGNYNTLGSYRVQYSATNPFLNHFNPSSNDTNTNSDS